MLIGLDIGGTKTEAVVLDNSLRARGRAVQATNTRTPEQLVAGAVEAIHAALAQAEVPLEQVSTVGVGVPGQVDPETGEVRLAVNLHLAAFPLGQALAAALQVPCRVENDVRAAAVGVYRLEEHAAIPNMAYVNIGTGVSAGLILGGKLYRGSHGMAGEIGHIVVEADGPLCNCGTRGCLETLVAGPAIARQGRRAIEAGEATLLREAKTLNSEAVYEAAEAGDMVGLRITAQVGSYLGRALHGLVMAYDVERIVLGGGVTHAGEPFLSAIQHAWQRQREHSPLAQAMLKPETLRLAGREHNMVAHGAAVLAAQAWERASANGLPLQSQKHGDGARAFFWP